MQRSIVTKHFQLLIFRNKLCVFDARLLPPKLLTSHGSLTREFLKSRGSKILEQLPDCKVICCSYRTIFTAAAGWSG